MLWIVLPSAIRDAVSIADVCIAKEVIVVVDVDIVSAPSGVPAPTSAPERSHRYTGAEGQCHPGCVVTRRIWIHRGAPHHHRIVGRYVNNFLTRWLDYDHSFVIGCLGLHFQLLGRFQMATFLRLFPHALDRRHHIALLREKGIPQISRPLNIVGQPFHYVPDRGQRLDAWVPRLLCHRVG